MADDAQISLSDRVKAVLTETVPSTVALAVLREAEASLETFDPLIQRTRDASLDPLAASDAVDSARTALIELDFAKERTVRQVDALKDRLSVLRREEQAKHRANVYAEVKAERDQLVIDLAEVPQLITKLASLIRRVNQNDQMVESVNMQLEGREWLTSSEVQARKLSPHFTKDGSYIPRLADSKLPSWFGGGTYHWAWPPQGYAG